VPFLRMLTKMHSHPPAPTLRTRLSPNVVLTSLSPSTYSEYASGGSLVVAFAVKLVELPLTINTSLAAALLLNILTGYLAPLHEHRLCSSLLGLLGPCVGEGGSRRRRVARVVAGNATSRRDGGPGEDSGFDVLSGGSSGLLE
jgi:hypothetical protein